MALTTSRLVRMLIPAGSSLLRSPFSACSWRALGHDPHAAPPETPNPEGGDQAQRATVNRLLYRARQRGWLELDLLVGMWAERQLAALQPDALQDFEVLLNQENPDVYKWLTDQLQPPEHMRQNRALILIKSEVQGMMSAHNSGRAAAPKGADWVRGWDDNSKQLHGGSDEKSG